jgi:CO/xanthine dehydrogenase Mo-binding subunit
VRSAATDIGTGTYAIATQLAAELLGLDIRQVRVEIGDSDLPSARFWRLRAGRGAGWRDQGCRGQAVVRPRSISQLSVNAISELVPGNSRASNIGENVNH